MVLVFLSLCVLCDALVRSVIDVVLYCTSSRVSLTFQKVSNLDFSSGSRRRQHGTAMVPSKFFEIFSIQLQFLRMQVRT